MWPRFCCFYTLVQRVFVECAQNLIPEKYRAGTDKALVLMVTSQYLHTDNTVPFPLCYFMKGHGLARRGAGVGAGIAQWLERRTRDWKVAGSNPCWNGGRIFFSRVDFLCWLLFRYPFHPRVTTVARKKSRSFCQKCRWQVTAKHAYTLRMWLLLNRASALVTTCP